MYINAAVLCHSLEQTAYKMDALVGKQQPSLFVHWCLVARVGGTDKEYWMCWHHIYNKIGSDF